MNFKQTFNMSLPTWVERQKLEKSLQSYLKDNSVKIVDLVSKNAVPIGDNYTSDLFRTKIKYTTKKSNEIENFSVIIKCAGDDLVKGNLDKELKMFEKETFMFGNTLPLLHKTLGEVCISAPCLFTELQPHGLIILEDLTPLGYKMASRQRGLDMDHCFLVLEKIAQLHASSAVLFEKDPQTMSQYTKGLLTNQSDNAVLEQFIMSGFKSLIVTTRKWPGYEKYSHKLTANVDKLFKKTMECCKIDKTKFNVLNHGDLWTNNILFLYENDRPVDLRFVDFQFSIFTTPVVDLHYFICTSPKKGIEQKHLPRLLGFYHEQLVENLIKLKYPKEKIPTYEYIIDEYYKKYFYALASAAVVLPIVRAPESNDASFEELMKEDNEQGFRKTCYNGDMYRDRMEELLPYYEALGLFD